MANLTTVVATIAAGESLSDAIDFSSKTLATIIMPPEWTQAGLTFQISVDGADYYDLWYAITGETTMAVIPGTAVIVPRELSVAFNFLKLRSGASASPVAQQAERQFMLAVTQAAAATQGPA